MFRPTSPQLSLLESRFLVSPAKRRLLEKSWAQGFRDHVLSRIDEEPLKEAFASGVGRPNASVRLLTGLHILKEFNNLTDTEVLEQLEFNLQWQHALAVDPTTVHLCQKTLHNYRVRLMEHDRAREMFTSVVQAMARMDGLNLRVQRLDSTHVMSNIAVLGRLGLFVETVNHFLKELKREAPATWSMLPGGYATRYLEREGYFADAGQEVRRCRLSVVARDAYRLVERYKCDEMVSGLSAYVILARLVSEQCEVVEKGKPASDVSGTGGESGREVVQLEVFVSTPEAEAEEESAEPEPETGDDASAEGLTEVEANPGDSWQSTSSSLEVGGPGAEATTPEIRVKTGTEVGPASLQSPYDPDATYGHKGKGYEVQVTETCGEGNPYHLITDIEVVGAHESDQRAVQPILKRLKKHGLAPESLYADTAYGSGENIVEAGRLGVDLRAPVQDPGYKRHPASGFEAGVEDGVRPPSEVRSDDKNPGNQLLGLGDFRYQRDYHGVESCPEGHSPKGHQTLPDGRSIVAQFGKENCDAFPLSALCPTQAAGRLFGSELKYPPAKAATERRQQEQKGAAFKKAYRIRSGIEATNALLKGPHGANDLRVRENRGK